MIAASRTLQRFAPALILLAGAIMVGVLWFGAVSAILEHRAAARARIEMAMQSKADLAAGEIRRELLVTDQSLRILEVEWERDPASFNFDDWRKRLLALSNGSLQIFRTDSAGIVRQSSRADLVGDDVISRDYFQHELLLPGDEQRVFIGSLIRGLKTHLWQINIARRLDTSNGSFAGVIVASLDAAIFESLADRLDLRAHGLLVVVDNDGSVRGLGNVSLLSGTLSIAGSPIFNRMAHADRGIWRGPAPLDHADRIMAFATVPGYGLRVLVGAEPRYVLAPALEWQRAAIAFSAASTLLVLAMVVGAFWVERGARIHHTSVLREQAALAQSNLALQAAEQRERAKAQQLEATLSGMSDGIMMVDTEMRLLAWNAHFPEFTGVPKHILRIGLPMQDILHAQAVAGEFGDIDPDIEAARRMTMLQLGASMGTIERRRPDGRILEIRRNRLPDDGFVTLYSDITNRRTAEERARRAETLAATGRLTAGIAHDFNNLLASISANAEMLGAELPSELREARRVHVILKAADRGAALIRQLLAFARNQTLKPRAVDLHEALEGFRDLLNSSLRADITLELECKPDLWLALVDPVQFEQMVLNLAINARDAMPLGGRLRISASNVTIRDHDPEDLASGDYVMLAVRDTGTGIAESALPKVFEPFFTTKAPGRGSGLGLSQVYGVARQSGGSVRIDSKVDQGTEVRVFLPRAAAVDRPAAVAIG